MIFQNIEPVKQIPIPKTPPKIPRAKQLSLIMEGTEEMLKRYNELL